MDLTFSAEDEAFRAEARDWLEAQLQGEFAVVRHRGGPGDEHALFDERMAWEQRLGEAGWTCIAWPKAYGGRGATLAQQVIFNEEYARAGGPGRLGHIGETLAGPTIIAFGTEEQKARFLPGIREGRELWCQGYSEPNAGSDLANVQTRAVLDGDRWILNGQKVWTSGAHWSKWCFVIARTDASVSKHRGLSYLLVPMDQPGVDVKPIVQVTGSSEFNEVFFEDAETHVDNVVGGVNNGWRVAMGTLSFERGASTLGQQLSFTNELNAVIDAARQNGKADDPVIRQRIAKSAMELRIMRYHALRALSAELDGAELSPAAMTMKIYWATWHRALGELAMDVLGAEGLIRPDEGDDDYPLTALQQLFLFTRSDTIYAGSNQIQRNIIGERALGLPREPR